MNSLDRSSKEDDVPAKKPPPKQEKKKGKSIKDTGITGIFSGGTEFTPQFTRFAVEELLDNGAAYMTPTYGNTLMGLACSRPVGPHDGYKITYHAPQPRAVLQVVDFDAGPQQVR